MYNTKSVRLEPEFAISHNICTGGSVVVIQR